MEQSTIIAAPVWNRYNVLKMLPLLLYLCYVEIRLHPFPLNIRHSDG